MACDSAAKVVSDVFQESRQVASGLSCAVATGVGAVVGVPIDYTTCFQTVEKAAEFTEKMVDFWNDMVGNEEWSTIGERLLTPNVDYKGTLWSTGGRRFITPYPLKKDTAKLIITERDGKAKTSVEVCKYSEAGGAAEIATRMFNETDNQKDEQHGQRIIELRGIKNHVLVVHLDNKSVGNKFAYTIRLEM